MSGDDDRLSDLLRKGPPEEEAYDPPEFAQVSRWAERVQPPLVRRHTDVVVRSTGRGRPVATVAVLGLAAAIILGTAAVLIGGAPPLGTETAAPSTGTASLVPRKSGQPTVPPANEPIVATGWPISFPRLFGETADGAVTSDGSFYIAGPNIAAAIDPTGHLRVGWPVSTPIDQPVRAPVVAADGSVFVMNDTSIVDLDPSGRIRPGWPLSFPNGFGGPFVGPNGAAVLVATLPSGASRLIGLDLTSPTPEEWVDSVPGLLSASPQFLADGSIVLPLVDHLGQPSETQTIVAFSTGGQVDPIWSSSGWQGMAPSSTGDLAVWSYDLAQEGSRTSIVATHLALLGSDGRTLPGWPRVLAGAVSAPALGPDGTVYLTSGIPGRQSTGTLTALDRSGHVRAGFPVDLPNGCSGLPASELVDSPPVVQAPAVSTSGMVYVACVSASHSMISAFDQGGRTVGGWPYTLESGDQFAGVGGSTPGGPEQGPLIGQDGLIYLVINGPQGTSIICLDRHGAVSPGWPVRLSTTQVLLDWMPDESGGLELRMDDAGTRHLIVTRLTANGVVVH